MPLAFVLTDAALDDLFNLWVVDFIKAGWFDALYGGTWVTRLFSSIGLFYFVKVILTPLS